MPHQSSRSEYRAHRAAFCIPLVGIPPLHFSVLCTIPRVMSQDLTCPASSAAVSRIPWSTVKAVTFPPLVFTHSFAKSVNAMLSLPPDTATAMCGHSSNGPKCSMRAENPDKESISASIPFMDKRRASVRVLKSF